MKKNKFLIILSVFVITTLGSISIYTALKIYNLRKEPIALNVPKSNVFAASCSDYELSVDTDGTVRIVNNSTETQFSKNIDLIVNGQSIGSFTVPQLSPENDAILGNINLPEGDFNWSINGDILCQGDTGGTTHNTSICQMVNFTVNAQEITTTPSPTGNPTLTPTQSPTVTQSTNQTSTPTYSTAATKITTPTPIQLPDSGLSVPTLGGIFLGIIIISASILLAL